jgi:hypothetical protein
MTEQRYGPNSVFEQPVTGEWKYMFNGRVASHDYDSKDDARAALNNRKLPVNQTRKTT